MNKDRIYKCSDFVNKDTISDYKKKKNLSVSVIIPTLNEEDNILKVLLPLMELIKKELIDDLIVVDGGSTDSTVDICKEVGCKIYLSDSIVLDEKIPLSKGKGIQLWKSIFLNKSDIVCFVDADIKNFTENFVLGLVIPMILDPNINFTKSFYKRNIYIDGEQVGNNQGGRVTELCARPLLNILYPELAFIIQPLSGEYAFKKEVIEDLEFSNGFGLETKLLIDYYKKYGIDSLLQIDMGERIHRNKNIKELSKTSYMISHVVLNDLLLSNGITKSLNTKFFLAKSDYDAKSNLVDDRFSSLDINEIILPCVRKKKILEEKEILEIFIIRHGGTDYLKNNIIQGQIDCALNAYGKMQCKHLSSKLENIDFTWVYSSDLTRCVQTCEFIAKNKKSNIKYTDKLRERNYGIIAGQSKNSKLVRHVLNGSNISWHSLSRAEICNAEDINIFYKRIIDTLKEIFSKEGKVLLVTHSGVINAIYRTIKKLPKTAKVTDMTVQVASCYKLTISKNNISNNFWTKYI